MGLFDSVLADCPNCGRKVEFQSKAGECFMRCYAPNEAPPEVLADVLNDPQYCRHCDNWMALVDPAHPPGPPKRPDARAVRLREPDAAEISVHASQPFLRWWNAPFSYADIVEVDRPC
jgi:hypothetical protein